jgi:hypothetical protein
MEELGTFGGATSYATAISGHIVSGDAYTAVSRVKEPRRSGACRGDRPAADYVGVSLNKYLA